MDGTTHLVFKPVQLLERLARAPRLPLGQKELELPTSRERLWAHPSKGRTTQRRYEGIKPPTGEED
jgi:hypothetical protein